MLVLWVVEEVDGRGVGWKVVVEGRRGLMVGLLLARADDALRRCDWASTGEREGLLDERCRDMENEKDVLGRNAAREKLRANMRLEIYFSFRSGI